MEKTNIRKLRVILRDMEGGGGSLTAVNCMPLTA